MLIVFCYEGDQRELRARGRGQRQLCRRDRDEDSWDEQLAALQRQLDWANTYDKP